MNTEALEMTIAITKEELEKRPARKNIAMIAIALLLFLGPLVIFFTQPDNVYQTGFGPIVAGWLMICVLIGHITSSALFVGRTIELALALETAATILELAKEKESNE